MVSQLDRLIQTYQQLRNARELANIAYRNFARHLEAIELTDEVIAWAMTTTPNNASRSDEAMTAWYILHRRLREGKHAHGDTVG